MNRRSFFRTAVAAVAAAAVAPAAVLDPEKALWVPGRKTIFIPPPPKVIPASAVEIIRRAQRLMEPWLPEPSKVEMEYAYKRLNEMLERWNGERISPVPMLLTRPIVPYALAVELSKDYQLSKPLFFSSWAKADA